MTEVCPKDKVWLGKRGEVALSWQKGLENGITGHLNILVKNWVGAGNQRGFGNQKERKRNEIWRQPQSSHSD